MSLLIFKKIWICMNNKSLDQIEILRAVDSVRLEMKMAHSSGASKEKIYRILDRLLALYSLLDVKFLSEIVVRNEFNKNDVA